VLIKADLDHQFTSRLTCCAQPRFPRICSTGNLNCRSGSEELFTLLPKLQLPSGLTIL
jgi:hypothetical protein